MQMPEEECLSTAAWLRHRILSEPPKLAYRDGLTRARFIAWQGKVRRKLRSLMALQAPATKPPRLIATEPREGYQLQKWEMFPEPGSIVPFYALMPNHATRKDRVPAVLCFPGTDHSKELLAGEPELPGFEQRYHKMPARPDQERMGWHFARAGYVAICVDNPATQSMRDARWPGRTELSEYMILLGRSYFSLGLQHGRELFRWARMLPFVDPTRIAASGHSLGSNVATFLTVLEPRIAALVHNCHVSTARDRFRAFGLQPEKMWQVVPGMLDWFDRPDLLASLAPRPLLICEGCAPWHLRHIRDAYDSAGAGANFTITYNPAYATAASRCHAMNLKAAPEGVDEAAYKRALLQDSPNHYFKADIAVPWLVERLGR